MVVNQEYKYAKQVLVVEGHMGIVSIKLEPMEAGDGYEFIDEITGGVFQKSISLQ